MAPTNEKTDKLAGACDYPKRKEAITTLKRFREWAPSE